MTEGPKKEGKKKLLFKVLVIGDYAVGKTSLIKRYTEGFYTPNYKLTIGVDFAVKVLDWDENTQVSLQLWDVAGHERFGTMTRVYYKYAIAAIIGASLFLIVLLFQIQILSGTVFDVSRPATFEAVTKWREDVNSKVVLANNDPIPCMLLANKRTLTTVQCDIPGVNLDKRALDQFARDHNFIAWYPTSAANNINIDEAMNFLVGKIMEISATNIPQPPESQPVHPSDRREEQKKEGGCCGN